MLVNILVGVLGDTMVGMLFNILVGVLGDTRVDLLFNILVGVVANMLIWVIERNVLFCIVPGRCLNRHLRICNPIW